MGGFFWAIKLLLLSTNQIPMNTTLIDLYWIIDKKKHFTNFITRHLLSKTQKYFILIYALPTNVELADGI